jgi:hypothetical protein
MKMNKIKECKCVFNYTVTCMKYLGNGKHSEVYDKVIFHQNKDYVFDIIDEIYYISTDKKYLRHKNDYNTDVYYLTKEEFEKHFIKI